MNSNRGQNECPDILSGKVLPDRDPDPLLSYSLPGMGWTQVKMRLK